MTTTKDFKPLDINLAAVLGILEQESSSHEDKSDAYSQITKHMKEDDLSLFDLDLSRYGKQVVTMAIRDIMDDNVTVCQLALRVLGFCLHDKEIVKSLGIPLQTKCLVTIQKCLNKADDKVTCTRAMWCIGNQSLSDFIVKGELEKLLKVIEKVWNNWINHSTMVENEAAKAIVRLFQQDPDGMKQNLGDWASGTLLSLVHLNPQTGSKLLMVANEVFTIDNIQLWSKTVCNEYKGSIGPKLKKMMNDKQEVHALRLWSLYIKVLGKELHHGNFINLMLPLVELGFKSINAEVKIEAFRSWKQLILNFAMDIHILSDQKRIKLIMQVFKLNNAKTEPVAAEKFKTWWFFISKLGSKAVIIFDQVCLPLLNFCLGGHQICTTGTPRIQSGKSPLTPHLNLPPNSGSGLPKLDKLQRYTWEVLAHYLGEINSNQDVQPIKYQIEPSTVDFIPSPAAFIKHSTSLIIATIEALNLEFTTEAVLHRIWYALVGHIKKVLESGIKSDVKEMFTFFLTQFQTLVLSQTMSVPKILAMFDPVCCLPKRALSSTAYNISNGEKIHGNPALFLMELLLTPSVLSKSQRNERYMTIFNNLTAVGIENGSGYLEFCQSVLELIGRNSEFIKEPDCIWRLWSRLSNTLQDQINKTNEINQGDSLEHNFSCMYNILVFPIQHKITHLVTAPVYKTMVKTWNGLFSTLSRLSALVTTAEANTCCEELCHIILKDVNRECFLNLNGLDFAAQACLAIVNCVDFGSIGTVGNFNIGGISPAKWAKKKQKPLENLQSFVHLVCRLSGIFAELTKDFMSSPQKLKSLTRKIDSGSPNLTSILSTIFETVSTLYTNVTSSSFLIKLLDATVESIGALYKLSGGWSGALFLKKTEKLTESICNSIQKHYSGPIDSDFLKVLSPFLEATLEYPRRSISLMSQNLWSCTLSTAPSLDYPESLSNVLQNMARKNRLQISVPGWLVREENVIDETPCSELTQGDSQAPEPHIPGMPSPNKVRGSFLHKVVSPNIKKSPAKMKEKTPNSAKRKIMTGDDFQNDVFVVIKSPPPKTNPLTEHQIEIFREKRTMPAMYNTLDASQDVSLMAHFKSDDTHSKSQKTQPMINLLDKGKDIPCRSNQDDKLSPDEMKSEPRIHGKMNKNRKIKEAASTRQTRSVRFSNETFEDPTSPDATPKDIGHFNVIKTMMQKIESPSTVTVDKSIESKPEEANNSLIGREENEIDSAHQLLSLSTPRISPPEKSTPTDSPVKDEEYQPSPSQRKLDSWLIRSPVRRREVELLPETFKSNVEKSQAKQGTSAKKQRGRKSIGLTEDTNSPVKRSRRVSDSCLRSTNDKNSTKLQKVTEEPSSQKKTAKSSAKKSPGEASFIQKDNPSTVVVPLVEETQSPKKLKQASDCNDFVKPNVETRGKSCSKVEKPKVSPIIAVIEETQSPKKKIQCDTNSAVPILETPPRPGRSDLTAMSGNRKLFLSQDGEMIEHCEDSNIIPASPTSNKSMKLGTPVIKLKKLTQDEILQYSPSRKESKGEISSSTSTQKKRRGRTCKNSNLASLSDPSSSKSSDKELAKFFLHEHDDFSDLRPILTEQTEELLSSGQTDERGGVSGDLPLSQGFDIGTDTSISKDNKISQGNGSEKEIPTKISSFSGSEALFTEQEPEEYDPCFESTLSDPTIKAKKSKSEKSPTSSTLMKNDDISKTQDKAEAETQQKMESEVYNPHLESTLASPPAFGSARKRKQKTPKKLSPESAGPSKRKRRCISQSSKLSDENSIRDELKEEMSSTSSHGDVSKNDRKKNTKEKISSQDIYKNEDEAKCLQSDIEIKDFKSGLLSSNVDDIDGADMNSASHTSVVFNKDLGITNPVKSSSIIPPEVNIIVGNVEVDVSIMKKRTLYKHSDDVKKSPLQTDDYIDIDFDESFTEMDPNKNVISLSDTKIDKTPESCFTINKQKMEKTPENRSIQDIPTRVSTTKKKKEVAQKRSLSKGKSSIPLDLDANLDPNECTSSSDKLVSLDLVKESEIENDMDILHSTEDVTENENSIQKSNADLKVIPSKIGLCTPEKVNTRKTRNNALITEISEEYSDSVVIPETNEENIQEDISLDSKLSCNSSVTEDNSALSDNDKNKKQNRKKPRVSTTKKKKEVAQKRSLSKGKSSIPLDLDANLDPNECTSSSDKLVSLDLVKESEIENDMDILHSTEDVTENENSIQKSNADLKVIPSKIGLCIPEKVNTRKTRNNALITEISEEYSDSVVIPETNEENIQEDISLDSKLSCNSSVTEDNSALSDNDKNKKRNRKKPRVSTTKKKKEVAQKRSLSKGKSSIPLDLDANLDPNECTSSSDKLVSLDLVKESEIENDMDILHSTEDVTENENSIQKSNADLKVIPSKIGLCIPEKVNTRKTRNNALITEISEEYSDSVVIPETNEENIQEDISLDSKLSCNSSVTEDNSALSDNDKNKKRNRKKPIQKELDNEIIGSQYEMVQTNQILSEHDSSEKHDKFDINYTSTIAEKVDNSCQNKGDKGDNPVIVKDINLTNNSSSEMGDNCHLRTDNSNLQTENSSGSGKESSSTDFFFAKEAEEMLENSTILKDTEDKLDNRLSASLTNESDDIPLCDLKSNKAVNETSPISDAENRSDLKKQLSTIKRGRPKKKKQQKRISSPLSQTLRSSKITLRTRGIPIRKSAGGMLSLSKAKKINHLNLSIKDLQEDNFEKDKVALTEIDKNIKSNDEVIVIKSQSQDKEVTDYAFTEMVPKNKETSMVEDIAGPDNLKKFNDILQDETPRKAPDVTSTRKDLRFAERHTDSKLVVVPRKFEKRSNMARRSILKPSSQSLSLESPSQRKFQDFHPIKIGHVFAPSASPSAGILKRRRLLSGEIATNSPSPPSKQRRVSFAEPVSVSKELLSQTSERPASPLVTSDSTVSSSLEEFFAASSESQKPDSLQSKKDSQMTLTQSSYTSTQQSQLDTTEAVYPDLTSCSVSVDKILPQLTSSLWARGLGSLIKARNIHTIGDLSSLSEKQVDELPIRSPKVSVVRKVLKKYGEQTNSKQSKNISTETNMKQDEGGKEEIQVTENKSPSTDLLDHVDSPDQEIQEILQTKESKKLYVDSDKNNTNTDTATDSGNERECVYSALTTTDNASIGAPSQSAEKSDEKPDIKKTNIVSTLETLVEQCSGNKMKDVRTQDIFIIHQQLSKLTNTVVDTLKERCTSPSDK